MSWICGRWDRQLELVMRAVAGLALLLAASSAGTAQVRIVEIQNADLIEVTEDSTGTVRRMTGNVRLRQDTTFIRADRATEYERQRLYLLSGNVRIISGRDTLTARTVTYDANTKVSIAEGNVRVGNGESTLFAPSTRYDSRAEVSAFEGGGRILNQGAILRAPSGTYDSPRRFARLEGPVSLEDSTGTLHAQRGTYDARVQRADFAGEVRLRRPDARMHADSVVYFRRTERARAYGQVVLQRLGEGGSIERVGEAPADSSARTILFGEQLLFDGQEDLAQVRGSEMRDPLLLLLKADSTGQVDTTLARAPRLDVLEQVSATGDTLRVLIAAGGARLTQRDLAARADSVRLVRTERRAGDPPEDRFGFYGTERPRVWADGSQLTADTLLASARGGAMDTLFAIGAPFAATLDSTLGRVQQLKGRKMHALFDRDRVRQLDVWPNAEAVYHLDDGNGRLEGVIELTSDSLSFGFEEGEVRRVYGSTGNQGTQTAGNLVTGRKRLSGYAFSPRDAPTSDAVLDPGGWEAAWLRRFGPSVGDLMPPVSTATARIDEVRPRQN